MSEYIKKDDALRKAIVVKVYLDNGNAVGDAPFEWINAIPVKKIESIPAADVEPVVRCRDCVAYAGKERKGGGIMMICRINKHEASPEHFCSQGRNRAHMERSGSGE